jgi:MATE family multidrug resistance protein
VRVPAFIGVGVIWTCVPTSAFALGRLAGWGAAGGWVGFLAETTLGAVLFSLRWRRGAWRNAYARGAADVAGSNAPQLARSAFASTDVAT